MKKSGKVLISLIVVGLLCVVAYPAVSEIFGLDSALINKSGRIVALGDFGEVSRRKYGTCRFGVDDPCLLPTSVMLKRLMLSNQALPPKILLWADVPSRRSDTWASSRKQYDMSL